MDVFALSVRLCFVCEMMDVFALSVRLCFVCEMMDVFCLCGCVLCVK